LDRGEINAQPAVLAPVERTVKVVVARVLDSALLVLKELIKSAELLARSSILSRPLSVAVVDGEAAIADGNPRRLKRGIASVISARRLQSVME
jgi:hypothetical protein